jgi:hypothetical protein
VQRARIDSTPFSHVVVCPACGYRECFATAAAARDARDRHDMAGHPEHYHRALNALEMRSVRRARTCT